MNGMKEHIDFNEKKRLKIAFFTHWYFPEKIGCSTRVDNYCKTFSKYYDVDIICPVPEIILIFILSKYVLVDIVIVPDVGFG